MHIIIAVLFAAAGCLLARLLIPAGTPQLLACILAVVGAFFWGGWGPQVLPANNGPAPNYALGVVLLLVVIFVALRLAGHL